MCVCVSKRRGHFWYTIYPLQSIAHSQREMHPSHDDVQRQRQKEVVGIHLRAILMQDPEPHGPQRGKDHGPHEHRFGHHLVGTVTWCTPRAYQTEKENASGPWGEDCRCAHGRDAPLCATRQGIHPKSPSPTDVVGSLKRKRHPHTAALYVPRHHHGRCTPLRTRGFVCTAGAHDGNASGAFMRG